MDEKVEGNCRTCKDYRKCIGHSEGYSYAEIRWCPFQVLWLLENLERLRATGWIYKDDSGGSPNVHTEASFVTVITVIAEVEVRLEATGKHGERLKEQAEEGRSLKQLSPQARAALMYIKGWRRKRISYSRWLREVYYQRKKEA